MLGLLGFIVLVIVLLSMFDEDGLRVTVNGKVYSVKIGGDNK